MDPPGKSPKASLSSSSDSSSSESSSSDSSLSDSSSSENEIDILSLPVRYALISTYDKTGIEELAQFLINEDYHIISTGGTYQLLSGCCPTECLTQVSDLTGFPEILEGRVKTLHPKIFGGILANRKRKRQRDDLDQHQIPTIDIVVVNLYPFHQAPVDQPTEATELIDIGGVCLLRAAAKNCDRVTVLSQPADYQLFMDNYDYESVGVDTGFRQQQAIKAFQLTSAYDQVIANYFLPENQRLVTRHYLPLISLKYGCNPHQKSAQLYQITNEQERLNQCLGLTKFEFPLKILNGQPGYINILDAFNAWGLVKELDKTLGRPAAASFKHTSPAGVGVSRQLHKALTKARQGDPKSSFGDFIGLSRPCNLETAKLIKSYVSDGVIAPAYEPEALELLRSKKDGNYLILSMDPEWRGGNLGDLPPDLYQNGSSNSSSTEMREMLGMALSQAPNKVIITRKELEELGSLSYQVINDLLLANITLKYSQSNNIVMAKNGQVIGVAAGQQSRIDAVRLAGQKAQRWYLRQHPRVKALEPWFSQDLSGTAKTNLIEDFLVATEPLDPKYTRNTVRPVMTTQYKQSILDGMQGVCLASDAFFPFRDNIDEAQKYGVEYIIQPGGSRNDQEVIEACAEYNIQMIATGLRMFTH